VEHVAEEVKKQLASQPMTVEEVVVENSTQPKAAKAKIKVGDHKTTKTVVEAENSKSSNSSTGSKDAIMAQQIIEAIGVDNFVSVDNCATRLRLVLNDNTKVDEAKIKASGAYGTKRFADGRF
jgi:glucose-like phosphotransferase system IIB component